MKTHRMIRTGLLTCAVATLALSPALQAAPPSVPKVIESQRRMDPTGSGTYHRVGMLREIANTQRMLEKKQKAGPVAQNARVSKS